MQGEPPVLQGVVGVGAPDRRQVAVDQIAGLALVGFGRDPARAGGIGKALRVPRGIGVFADESGADPAVRRYFGDASGHSPRLPVRTPVDHEPVAPEGVPLSLGVDGPENERHRNSAGPAERPGATHRLPPTLRKSEKRSKKTGGCD